MNFNQLCPRNYGNTQQKRFFEHLLELRSLLEDKNKLLFMPFFISFLPFKTSSVLSHNTGLASNRNIKSMSN